MLLWVAVIWIASTAIPVTAQQSPQSPPADQKRGSQPSPLDVKPADTDPDRRSGVSVGSFRLDAGLTVTETFDDNIFATRTGRINDRITTVAPFATLRSDWERHALGFDASAAFGRYDEFSSEDYDDFSVGADGRFDLSGESNVFGGARFSRRHEERESPDAVNGTEPTIFDDIEAHAGTFQQFGPVTLRLGGTYERLDFQDVAAAVGEINNDDRDRDIFEAGTRLGYVVDRMFEPFVQAALNWRRYDEQIDDFGFDRDSRGLGVAAGVRINLGRGLSGEALVGYLHQSYTDGRFSDVDTFDVGALLSWRPLPGTRFNLSLDRTIEETTLAGASGYLNTAVRLSIEHAITQSFILGLSSSYAHADYQSVDRTDALTSFGAELRYFFLPNLFIAVEDRFLRRDSNIEIADFDDNQILLRLGGQLSSGYRDAPDSLPLEELGLYGGVQVSHGQLGTELNGPRGAGGNLNADFGNSGFAGGAFAGYGATIQGWYVGFELDGDGSEAGWAHQRVPGGRTFGVDKGPSVAGTIRFGRWLPGGALVYARAGLAYAEFDSFYRTASGRLFEQTDGRFGARVGAGLEFLLSERLFGRFDYSVTDYRDYDVVYTNAFDNFDNTELLARFGIGYRLQSAPDGHDDHGPPPSFSGAYVGAQVGYETLETVNTGPRQAGSVLTADRADHGAAVGLFGGYGLTVGDFYFGAELDGGLSAAGWQIARDPTGRVYSVDKDESYGVSARLGYVLPFGTMIYARAGVVRTTVNTKYAFAGVAVDQDDTLTGLRLGGGVETPLTDALFLRFDYTHTSYDSYTVNYGAGIDTFDNEDNTVLVGVAYRP